MATFEKYIVAFAAFAIWILGWVMIEQINSITLPLAAELDQYGLLTHALDWAFYVQEYWILVGLIGILVGLLASGAANAVRGM